MDKVQLFYRDISEISGSNGFSVVRLTDVNAQRAVCVICDKSMSDQLAIRYNRMPGRHQMLPEVLLQMMADEGLGSLELDVNDFVDGRYQVNLFNRRLRTMKPIRMSDAVLLHYIARVPIYINEDLMYRLSSPYTSNAYSISIPISALETEHLNRELQKAIEEEDYRLASHLHEELERRKKK